MDYLSVNDTIVSDSGMQSSSVLSGSYVESTLSNNYQRFVISSLVMFALSKFQQGIDTNMSLQKGLYAGIATLLSDLLLGVAIRMNYLPNQSSDLKVMAGQVALESFIYFPIASQFEIFMPNFQGSAFKQMLTSSVLSQGAQYMLTQPSQSK